MYFVDRKTIAEKLTLMDKYMNYFNEKKNWETLSDQLALERIVHIVIESIIDVGNSIIDGFVMRDPGSYEDIINILLDEKVIDDRDGEKLKEVIALRAMVVRDFTKVEHEKIATTFNKNKEAILHFAPAINQYLKNELGHVTAFIPDENR